MAALRLCEICKQPLTADRLALPATRLCTRHAEEIVQYGGEFTLLAQQERTSKAGSLKINYGGIATEQTRNTIAVEKLRDAYEQENQLPR